MVSTILACFPGCRLGDRVFLRSGGWGGQGHGWGRNGHQVLKKRCRIGDSASCLENPGESALKYDKDMLSHFGEEYVVQKCRYGERKTGKTYCLWFRAQAGKYFRQRELQADSPESECKQCRDIAGRGIAGNNETPGSSGTAESGHTVKGQSGRPDSEGHEEQHPTAPGPAHWGSPGGSTRLPDTVISIQCNGVYKISLTKILSGYFFRRN